MEKYNVWICGCNSVGKKRVRSHYKHLLKYYDIDYVIDYSDVNKLPLEAVNSIVYDDTYTACDYFRERSSFPLVGFEKIRPARVKMKILTGNSLDEIGKTAKEAYREMVSVIKS
ncbi:MAG: hypothetical protein ACRCZ0_01895 [Cetobacterium sp.]